MQRSLTADLPVEQVAKVVRRHLVNRPSRTGEWTSSDASSSLPSQIPHPHARDAENNPILHSIKHRRSSHPAASPSGTKLENSPNDTPIFSTHLVLPGGAILDDLYKWTARVESKQEWRRRRAASVSLPVNRQVLDDPLLQSLKQPGGFRRHYVFVRAARQGKQPPNFLTMSFVEFLCLYGHFGGEDLSDDDDESSASSDISSDGDYESSSEEEESRMLAHERQNAAQAQGRGYGSYHGDSHEQQARGVQGLPLPVTTAQSSTARRLSMHGRIASPYQPVQFHQLQGRETMPLMSRSRPGQTLHGRATPGKAVFLLLKSFVTTGIMFLPKAFYNGGLLFSVVGIVLWALVSLWSFLLLVQTRLVIHASFGDMGGVLYGSKMKIAVLLAITLSQIGFVCAYMVFVAENLQSLVLAFSNCKVLIPMHLLILAQSFAFIPLAMIRKIQRLSVFALIADVFIVIGLGYLFYYDFKQLIVTGVGNVAMYNPVYFPLFIGTLAFTYEGVGLVIPITESMKEPQKFPSVLRRALFAITTLFISLGALSYLAFGDQVKTIILLNLPSKDPVVSSIQTLYSLAICLSIPLQLFPAIRIMENGLFTTRSGKNNAVVKWQKNVFRVIVVFLCAWIAVVGSKDKLDKFVPLIGALFCIPLCFIFPPLFHMKALSLPPARRAADIALIAFGVVCMISVANTTIHEWNSGDIIDPVKECVAHRI